MTDDLQRGIPGEDTHEADRGVDAPMDPDGSGSPTGPGSDGEPGSTDDGNPWLKEGADAPDAADIEDPSEQG